MGVAIDPVARRNITLLRAKIAQLEGRTMPPVMLPPAESFSTILDLCAEEWGASRELLLGESRLAAIVVARWAAMALARRTLGYSLPRIGRLLRRDHTSVLHGIRRITRMAEDDPDLAARLDRLAATITSQKQRRSRA